MATIKDVAKLAGVSVSTVSVAINTTPEEKKVAPQTRARILEAMHTLGYQPNIAARKLRMDENPRPIIAVFWPLDHRSHMIGYMLPDFQRATSKAYFDCEILVYPYKSGALSEARDYFENRRFNGAFIGATSENDMLFLQEITPHAPIVLYNRYLERYNTVTSDNIAAGTLAASLIEQGGYHTVSLFTNEMSTPAIQTRTDAFVVECIRRGITILSQYPIATNNQPESVIQSTRQMVSDHSVGEVLLFQNHNHALVSIYEMQKLGLSTPEDVKVLTMNSGDAGMSRFLSPSVTNVGFDFHEMFMDCINILMRSILDVSIVDKPIHKVYKPFIEFGETFPAP